MSDLTRRVLEADQYMDRSPVTDWIKFDHAQRTLEDAAPILARQVEAVERVIADAEEWIGPVTRNDYDEGMAELIDRILSALTDTTHYWSEPLQGDPQ